MCRLSTNSSPKRMWLSTDLESPLLNESILKSILCQRFIEYWTAFFLISPSISTPLSIKKNTEKRVFLPWAKALVMCCSL